MLSLYDCCCDVVSPCSDYYELIYDDIEVYSNFYYVIYSRSTYYEVAFYSNEYIVPISTLNFNVTKAVGVTSTSVSEIAYTKLLDFISQIVSCFFAYIECLVFVPDYSTIECKIIVRDEYHYLPIIFETIFLSTSGQVTLGKHLKQFYKSVPIDYIATNLYTPNFC